ncbi:WDGH domain-containing protein [Streptomyces sp. NPDC055709]
MSEAGLNHYNVRGKIVLFITKDDEERPLHCEVRVDAAPVGDQLAPLTVHPPEHWQPNCRPTREQQLKEQRDGVYRERAHLVAHLASLYPSHIGYTDPNAPDRAVVTIGTPAGQMSWHVVPRDMELFEHVARSFPGAPKWDGHTTEQKYERLRVLTRRHPGRTA